MEDCMKTIAGLALSLFLLASNGFAHSGGTNKHGCHNKHSDGTYHCHRSKK
ncbi:MAG: YHYH domain-containing protein [Pseudomonadota bacterium]